MGSYCAVAHESLKVTEKPLACLSLDGMAVLVSLVSLSAMAIAVFLFISVNSDGNGRLSQLGRRLYEVPTEPLATFSERSDTRKRLEQQYRWLTVDESDATAFLLAEAKAAFDATRDGIKSLDAKAGSLIGIVTTGLGAIALLGDASKVPDRTPFLYFGLFLLAVALFAAVLALPTRGFPVPRLSNYALLSTLAVNDNKARIQFELIESWLQDTRRAEAIAGGKARLLLIAAFTIVLGVLFLTVNWALGASSPAPSQPTTVRLLQGSQRP